MCCVRVRCVMGELLNTHARTFTATTNTHTFTNVNTLRACALRQIRRSALCACALFLTWFRSSTRGWTHVM